MAFRTLIGVDPASGALQLGPLAAQLEALPEDERIGVVLLLCPPSAQRDELLGALCGEVQEGAPQWPSHSSVRATGALLGPAVNRCGEQLRLCVLDAAGALAAQPSAATAAARVLAAACLCSGVVVYSAAPEDAAAPPSPREAAAPASPQRLPVAEQELGVLRTALERSEAECRALRARCEAASARARTEVPLQLPPERSPRAASLADDARPSRRAQPRPPPATLLDDAERGAARTVVQIPTAARRRRSSGAGGDGEGRRSSFAAEGREAPQQRRRSSSAAVSASVVTGEERDGPLCSPVHAGLRRFIFPPEQPAEAARGSAQQRRPSAVRRSSSVTGHPGSGGPTSPPLGPRAAPRRATFAEGALSASGADHPGSARRPSVGLSLSGRRRSSIGSIAASVASLPGDPLMEIARLLLDSARGLPPPQPSAFPKGTVLRHPERGVGEVIACAVDAEGRPRVHVRFGGAAETHRYAAKSLHKLEVLQRPSVAEGAAPAPPTVRSATLRRLHLLQSELQRMASGLADGTSPCMPLPRLLWILPERATQGSLSAALHRLSGAAEPAGPELQRLWAHRTAVPLKGARGAVLAHLRPPRYGGRTLSARQLMRCVALLLDPLSRGDSPPLSLPWATLCREEGERAREQASAAAAAALAAGATQEAAEDAAWAAAQRIAGGFTDPPAMGKLRGALREITNGQGSSLCLIPAYPGTPSEAQRRAAAAAEARQQAEAALQQGSWDCAAAAVERGVRSGLELSWLVPACASACSMLELRLRTALDAERRRADEAELARAAAARARAEDVAAERQLAAAAQQRLCEERQLRGELDRSHCEAREALLAELRARDEQYRSAEEARTRAEETLSEEREAGAAAALELRSRGARLQEELAAAAARNQAASSEALRARQQLRQARARLDDTQQQAAALAARAASAESTVALIREAPQAADMSGITAASPNSSPPRLCLLLSPAGSPRGPDGTSAAAIAAAQAEHARAESLLQRICGLAPVPCSPRARAVSRQCQAECPEATAGAEEGSDADTDAQGPAECAALDVAQLQRALNAEREARAAAERQAARAHRLAADAVRSAAQERAEAAARGEEQRRRCEQLLAACSAAERSTAHWQQQEPLRSAAPATAAGAQSLGSTDTAPEASPIASASDGALLPADFALQADPEAQREVAVLRAALRQAEDAAAAAQGRLRTSEGVVAVLRSQVADLEAEGAAAGALRRQLQEHQDAAEAVAAAQRTAADERELRAAAEERVSAAEAATDEAEAAARRAQAEAQTARQEAAVVLQRGASAIVAAVAERDELREAIAAENAEWEQRHSETVAALTAWQRAHAELTADAAMWRDRLQAQQVERAAAQEELGRMRESALRGTAAQQELCHKLEQAEQRARELEEAAAHARDEAARQTVEARRIIADAEQMRQAMAAQEREAAAARADAQKAREEQSAAASEAQAAARIRGKAEAAAAAASRELEQAQLQLAEQQRAAAERLAQAEARWAEKERQREEGAARREQACKELAEYAQQQQRRLQAELQAADDRCGELQQELTAERRLRVAAESDVERMSPSKARAELAERARDEQGLALAEAQREAEAAQTQLRRLQAQKEADTAEVEGLRAVYEQTLADLRTKLKQASEERDELKMQQQRVDAALRTERQRLQKEKQKQNLLEVKREASSQEQTKRAEGLREQLSAAQKEASKKEMQISGLRREVEGGKVQLRAAQQQIERLQQRLQEAQRNARQLRAGDADSRRQSAAVRGEQERELSALAETAKETRARLQREQQKVAAARMQAGKLELLLVKAAAAPGSAEGARAVQQAAELCRGLCAVLAAQGSEALGGSMMRMDSWVARTDASASRPPRSPTAQADPQPYSPLLSPHYSGLPTVHSARSAARPMHGRAYSQQPRRAPAAGLAGRRSGGGSASSPRSEHVPFRPLPRQDSTASAAGLAAHAGLDLGGRGDPAGAECDGAPGLRPLDSPGNQKLGRPGSGGHRPPPIDLTG